MNRWKGFPSGLSRRSKDGNMWHVGDAEKEAGKKPESLGKALLLQLLGPKLVAGSWP